MKIFKKCAKCVINEIQWKNFGFEHSNPEEFVKSKASLKKKKLKKKHTESIKGTSSVCMR